ncbi:MAG: hypothetical protein WC352_00100 [Candidatus Omnitrophota bacterium]|jgi:poly(3-hydroxybutyrate) depolymerase
MKKNSLGIAAGIFLIGTLAFAVSPGVLMGADENLGPKMPTGVMQLPETHHPAFLYVPENYDSAKSYPMIVSIPAGADDPGNSIQFWTSIAKRRSFIVLCPGSLLRPGSEPYLMDEWVLKLIDDISVRYQVDKKRVYLVGMSPESAHYAAYFGVMHHERFGAVALLGGSWDGYMEPMVRYASVVRKQPPFFLAFEKNADPDSVARAKAKAMAVEKKGYSVYLTQLEGDQVFDSAEFKGQVIDWLEEKSQEWYLRSDQSKKNWKTRFGQWLERNIKP